MRSLLSRRCRALAIAIAIAATAGFAAPAGAQDAREASPCLASRPDRSAYLAAFEADGWTRVEGEARRQALLGPGEFLLLSWLAAGNSGVVPPIEDRMAWDAEAREAGEKAHPPSATVLVRGGVTTVFRFGSGGPGTRVFCVITASDLPEAEAILARGSRRMGDIETVRSGPEPLPGGGERLMTAFRYLLTQVPPLAGAEVMTVTLNFGDAP